MSDSLKLRRLRKARGLTIDALASEIELSATSISEIERGRHRPSMRAARQLASGLGISAEYVIELCNSGADTMPRRRTKHSHDTLPDYKLFWCGIVKQALADEDFEWLRDPERGRFVIECLGLEPDYVLKLAGAA